MIGTQTPTPQAAGDVKLEMRDSSTMNAIMAVAVTARKLRVNRQNEPSLVAANGSPKPSTRGRP